MELLQSIEYPLGNREFEINTYRDTNNDSLVIIPSETTPGKKDDVSYLKSFVHMKGKFDLKPEDYPEYGQALEMVKNSLVNYLHLPTMQATF